ncbi:MAG: hypothetical protein E7256_13665 [Lachnospiraceae bacterium]|nr:hypothetical protein [Lachnospiraceae bacterium]
MALYQNFPIPSERMGELWTLLPVEGIAILEYGPAGTTHFSIEGFGSLQARKGSLLVTTDIDGSDIALGITKRLENAIDEVVRTHKPKLLFVSASSISSVIGTDIASILLMMQPDYEETVLIPLTSGGLHDYFSKGIEETLYLLAKHGMELEADKEEGDFFNLIGSCADDYNYEADAMELIRTIEGAFGMKAGCIFTSACTIDGIARMKHAKVNLVIRKEGIRAAEYMKKKYGIPYVYRKPYGKKQTMAWIQEIADVTGMTYDPEFIVQETKRIEEAMRDSAMRRMMHQKRVLLSGHYDTVSGIASYFREEGIAAVEVLACNNPKHATEEVPFTAEKDWLEIVDQFEGDILFADAVTLTAREDKKAIQIANPNLEHRIYYPYIPFVGFRGGLYLLEQILNLPISLW